MKILFLSLAFSLFLAACGAPEEPPDEKKKPQGRAETQSIRNTDAVGYSGSQIADQVDATLNANDERNKQLEKETEQEPE